MGKEVLWSTVGSFSARCSPHGGQRKAIEFGMWSLCAMTEFCTAVGRTTASLLLDISKAFENVRHGVLTKHGLYQMFNPMLLKWLLTTFQMPRRISFQGAVSEEVSASQSIVPGSSHADLMMMVMIMPIVLQVKSLWPFAQLGAVVDDLQICVRRGILRHKGHG